MDIRERVKMILKMCGHAFVITVHERLDREWLQIGELQHQSNQRFSALEQRSGQLHSQNIELAESQNAILESSLQMVETLREIQKITEEQRQLLKAATEHIQGLREDIGQVRRENAELRSILQQRVSNDAQHTYDAVMDLQKYTKTILDEELVRQVCVETSDYGFTNPETGLLSFLYSHLPTRKVVDVGAHVGDVSEALLNAGYEVYAFEPYAPVYEKLVKRLGRDQRFHSFQHAIGCIEGELPLHLAKARSNGEQWGDPTVFNSLTPHSMPETLPFSGTAMVTVKNLAGLHKSKLIPEDVSLVKIDTEGYDLEVIRGMGDHRYPIVAVEFWDSEIPFGRSGLLYTPQSMVEEMTARGYYWYIVLYRVWSRNQTAFYCNHPRPVPQTWGNMVFFRDYDLFSQGQAWCAAVLPRTYFKPAPVA